MTRLKNNIGLHLTEKLGSNKVRFSECFYSEVIRIPKKTFGRYLRNQKQPTLDELDRIANWLGVEPKELVNF